MRAISECEAAPGRAPAAMGMPPRGEVPGLTGLRFVAAFSVLLAHGLAVLMKDHEVPGGAVQWLKQASGFGMTLFFVLSGFVIHYNYATLVTAGRLRGISKFLWARFARLYPLFLLVLLVSVAFNIRPFHIWAGELLQSFHDTLRALPYFLLLVQSWFYVLIGEGSLIFAIASVPLSASTPLTWSISTEWFFYLVYPGIAWLVLRSRAPGWTVLAILLWGVLWATVASTIFDQSESIDAWAVARYGPIAEFKGDNFNNAFVPWLSYFSPYLRIGEFILGCLVAHLYVQACTRKITSRENLLGTAVFVAAAASVPLILYLRSSPDFAVNIFYKLRMNFAYAPTAALLIFCAARYDNVLSRSLTSRPAIVLGDASYSIYLLHFGLLILVRMGVLVTSRWTESGQHGIVVDLVALVLAMAAIPLISIVVYHCYEAPARRWLRRLWTVPVPERATAAPEARRAATHALAESGRMPE
jgi:peptidoglycan/LPS O-acetylase OafA/YrhL